MNEILGQKATVATIGGAKESLVFGARYDVRYGADDAILRGARLAERARNGDLVFDVAGATSRVRPSTIDAIIRIDKIYREPEETARDFVARSERYLGSMFAPWIETDEGQAALAAAAKEDQAARNGKVSRKGGNGEPKLTKSGKKKLVDAGADPELVEKATTVEEAGVPVHAEPGSLAARVLDAGKATSKGRPYAERNQVWRCGTCKRRTRAPFCANGHDQVDAPAGKRREDRGAS